MAPARRNSSVAAVAAAAAAASPVVPRARVTAKKSSSLTSAPVSPPDAASASAAPTASPPDAASASAARRTWLPRGISYIDLFVLLGSLALTLWAADARFAASVREALRPFNSATVRLADVSDARLQSGVMLVVYLVQYALLGGIFEFTHPDGVLSSTLSPERLALRRKQVRSEVATGVFSLVVTVLLAVLFMWKIEPHLWTYGFFETHEFTPAYAILGVVAYVVAFDTQFFWSHWILHESEFLWNSVHYYHHSYKEPSS